METNEIIPYKGVHPGSILGEELRERGIKQNEFALAIGMQASHLNSLIKGKRSMTHEIAIKIEEELGISYDFWMRVQAKYDYCKEKRESSNTLSSTPKASATSSMLDIYLKFSTLFEAQNETIKELQETLERTNNYLDKLSGSRYLDEDKSDYK